MRPSISCAFVLHRAARNARAAIAAAPGLTAAEIEVIVSVPLLDGHRLRAREMWEQANKPVGKTLLSPARPPRTPGRYA
ncbi:hypothetical protein [Zeimonas arvi]|uniref:Uncharacterized protein n=1 Tax=Zeimonas arvi TaxID=2498847 RepID=A0A5C8NRW3_9BURK|nr:hypothetical protein [Zeimonas arvi]TXL63565.1 hypothetical protein FHP08_17165 [Zeimonas arvi]